MKTEEIFDIDKDIDIEKSIDDFIFCIQNSSRILNIESLLCDYECENCTMPNVLSLPNKICTNVLLSPQMKEQIIESLRERIPECFI